jgi:hypothetical protein
LPFVSVQADICRENLLFELELDAMASVGLAPAKRRGNGNGKNV